MTVYSIYSTLSFLQNLVLTWELSSTLGSLTPKNLPNSLLGQPLVLKSSSRCPQGLAQVSEKLCL